MQTAHLRCETMHEAAQTWQVTETWWYLYSNHFQLMNVSI